MSLRDAGRPSAPGARRADGTEAWWPSLCRPGRSVAMLRVRRQCIGSSLLTAGVSTGLPQTKTIMRQSTKGAASAAYQRQSRRRRSSTSARIAAGEGLYVMGTGGVCEGRDQGRSRPALPCTTNDKAWVDFSRRVYYLTNSVSRMLALRRVKTSPQSGDANRTIPAPQPVVNCPLHQ